MAAISGRSTGRPQQCDPYRRRLPLDKFAPLIVAPVEGGRFAIVDGQHRVTAAAAIGIESVPAQVITADPTQQAAAFKSINGGVTRIHKMALHHAALLAGDPAAAELAAVTATAGVTIVRYPKPVQNLAAGETMALSAIASNLKAFDRETVITALQCVTETDNNRPGLLCAPIIHAVCAVLGRNHAWRDRGGRCWKPSTPSTWRPSTKRRGSPVGQG